MTTPDPTGEPPAPGPADGWGQPTSGAPGYAERPEPRYGQYAPQGASAAGVPPTPGVAPVGPGYGQPSSGQPQYGAYGQSQYGSGQYGQPQYGGPGIATPGGAAPFGYAPAAAKPGIVPLRPLTLGEIFDGAFGAIRHNPRVMLGMPAVVIAVATVAGTLLGYLISGYVVPSLPSYLASDQAFVDLISMWTSTLGMSLALTVASPIVNGLLIGSIGQSVIGRRVTLGQLWAQVKGRLWALLGFALLVSVVETVVVGLYVLAVVGLGSAGNAGVAAAVIVGLLGGLGLVAGLAWFTVRVLLVPPALVLEGQRLWPSVRRGWQVSRGSFWRLLGIYLLATLAVGIISSILTVPFALLGGFALEGLGTGAFLAITGLGTVLSGVLTSAFTAGVVCLLYIDLRVRREGLDVELAAAAADPGQAWDR